MDYRHKPLLLGGQFWTPIGGHFSTPIDTESGDKEENLHRGTANLNPAFAKSI
jgi:hypothetical protein